MAELPSQTATLAIGGARSPLPISPGFAGPLFLLQPIVDRLGGDLVIGPLQESHQLRIAETDILFGPGAGTITIGREIVSLTQAPVLTEAGVRVPLDALRKSYGDLLGLQFRWSNSDRELQVIQRKARTVGVELQVVHISGITTVVMQFDTTPSYKITDNGATVDVEVPVDRVRLAKTVRQPRRSYLEGVSTSDHLIRLELEPGAAAAAPYVLNRGRTEGLRLVFDISAGGTVTSEGSGFEPPSRREPGQGGLRTIVLDPGHGGPEQGAIGPAGTEEKELTLILAKGLRRRLQEALPVEVLLTRDDDADLPLDSRTAVANQNKADLFISIHLNASPDRSAHGAETYFLSLEASDERAQRRADVENQSSRGEGAPIDGDDDLQLLLWDLAQTQHLAASQRLARILQQELNDTLGLENRGVRQAPFSVLMGATMPAVLVELGFISNPNEESELLDPAYRASLLDAVTSAVLRFNDLLEQTESSVAIGSR
ncbi:MAG: N-acetylmuramoyl-L-alanine amidase [Acidobacteriota bacterium]|nr:N-acetylmuramoyl-L-alanine amidase [Acidobacteriota bacterium]